MYVLVTIKVQVQLNAVATDAAIPLTLAGRISPIISQGIGPKPNENPRTYTIKLANGSQPTVEISTPIFLQ